MRNAVIVFGSTTGNTKTLASMIMDELDVDVTLYNVTDVDDDIVRQADLVLLGASTWGYGELQEDFEVYYERMTSDLLKGKNVAVFGCGDKENFRDLFCLATDKIKKRAKECGANIIADSLKVDGMPKDHAEMVQAFAKSL